MARYAKFRAASMLEAVLNNWEPDDLNEKIGPENVDRVASQIESLALRLAESGWSLGEIEEARAYRAVTGRNRRRR